MNKKCYRYYGGMLVSQANWLNKMSKKGYRLVRTGKMLYEFEDVLLDNISTALNLSGRSQRRAPQIMPVFWRILSIVCSSKISI